MTSQQSVTNLTNLNNGNGSQPSSSSSTVGTTTATTRTIEASAPPTPTSTPTSNSNSINVPIHSIPMARTPVALHNRCVKMEALLRSPSSPLHVGGTWMERMAPLIGHVRLCDLRLPGAHDSGTFGFSNRLLDTWFVMTLSPHEAPLFSSH
jgi:hypothetical protein